MGTTPQVLHRSARAISNFEFLDALQATCPPRFPSARGINHRVVGLAVSGGVDSMAMAFLCHRARKLDPLLKVSDNPVSQFYGYIVDHGLRDGSTEEAWKVSRVLKEKIGIKSDVLRINWVDVVPPGTHPKDLPNCESVARRLRYHKLGRHCLFRRMASLFLAHHEDDQYETVLMRLLSGHGVRGLRGMRPYADIPECYDLHGAYQSGFLDDQANEYPYYNTRLTRRQRRYLRSDLKDEMDPETLARELEEGLRSGVSPAYLDDIFDASIKGSRWAPPLAPLDVEDAGIYVYRPLLGFSKDRLIATCLENNIPWFEDHTNRDPTLTSRNALRYLYRNHQLPVALQKPAVLRLSRRCNARVEVLDAEVDRLAGRVVVEDFNPNVGSVVVRLPHFSFPAPYRKAWSSLDARSRRLKHYRDLAALLIRRLIAIVGPDYGQLPPPTSQTWVISRLFPSLGQDAEQQQQQQQQGAESSPSHLKAFTLSNVHFHPIQPQVRGVSPASRPVSPVRWYLTRAPYPSNQPLPSAAFPSLRFRHRWRKAPDRWLWPTWTCFRLFDGRFWVRVRSRLPVALRVLPFQPEHAKPFREALADDGARAYLAAMLRRYAPAKVRYTLPGLYAVGDVDWPLLSAGGYWQGAQHEPPFSSPSASSLQLQLQQRRRVKASPPRRLLGEHGAAADVHGWLADLTWEHSRRGRKPEGGEPSLRLLALPTLGMLLPGMGQWLQYEVRYRKADAVLLENSLREEETFVARRAGWSGRQESARCRGLKRRGRGKWLVLSRGRQGGRSRVTCRRSA